MRREDAIKNELKKLHKVYVALYCLDCMTLSQAHVKLHSAMFMKCDPDNYIRELDFEF